MPVYEDLSVYEYRPDGSEGDVRNVGWLGNGASPPVGEVPAGFADRLARLAAGHAVNRTRGWQQCPFCTGEYPIRIEVDGTQCALGDAEIRVPAAGGTVYAAPTLIAHYVTAHRYRPPEEFIQAVMEDARVSSEM